jgi:hypothetical protein
MIAFDQSDIPDLGADFDHQRGAFNLEILDYGDGVAILQNITIGIFDHTIITATFSLRVLRPFVGTFGAYVH